MVAQEMVQQLQHSPIAERIQVMEALLQSIMSQKKHKVIHKPFVVRTFDLGAGVQIDREEMYNEFR